MPVRGSGSAKPSSLRSRESAQCILDVINLEPEPVNEGEVDEKSRGQNAGWCCAWRETLRETRDGMRKIILGTQFNLSHA